MSATRAMLSQHDFTVHNVVDGWFQSVDLERLVYNVGGKEWQCKLEEWNFSLHLVWLHLCLTTWIIWSVCVCVCVWSMGTSTLMCPYEIHLLFSLSTIFCYCFVLYHCNCLCCRFSNIIDVFFHFNIFWLLSKKCRR